MSVAIKRRRGTTAEHANFVGEPSEITIDTTKKTVVVHDGETEGGHPLATEAGVTAEVAAGVAEAKGYTDSSLTPVTSQLADIVPLADYADGILDPDNLLTGDYALVDAFGDSITAGDYNYPNDAQVSYPSQLEQLLLNNAEKTALVADSVSDELFIVYSLTDITQSAVAFNAGEYTMTSGAAEANPRFQGKTKLALVAGENYKLTMRVDTSAAGGKTVQPKLILYNAGGTALDTVYLRTVSETTSGYSAITTWINTDYLLIRQPTATQMVLGVNFNSDTTARTAKVDSVSLKKVNTNLINTPNILAEGGVEAIAGIVLTSTAGEANPRYLYNYMTLRSDRMYKVSITMDVTSCHGAKIKPRFAALNSSNAFLQEINPMSKVYASGSTATIEFVVDLAYLLRLNPTAARWTAGVRLESTGAGQILVVTSFTVRALAKGVRVNNRGISGETSTEAAARVSTIVSDAPDVCIIGYGPNDLRGGDDLSVLLANLTTIVNTLKAANIVPVLSTLTPLSSAQTNYSLVHAWNEAIKYLAAKLGVRLFDRFSALNNGDVTLLDDGCHPSSAGYALLAKSADLILRGKIWR